MTTSRINRCKPLLGTYVDVSIEADLDDELLLDLSIDAFNAVSRIHDALGFHNPDSELSALNRAAHSGSEKIFPISKDLRNVLSLALEISAASEGLFDVSIAPQLVRQGSLPVMFSDKVVGGEGNWKNIHLCEAGVSFSAPVLIDLGGIAKGYAVDQAVENIAASKMEADITLNINAGGDLYLNKWQGESVGVRYPDSPNKHFEMPMLAPALATSACYFTEQGSVMINPAEDKAIIKGYSVSVFAKSCMLADALTKLAFLNPSEMGIIKQYQARAFMLDSQNGLVELT